MAESFNAAHWLLGRHAAATPDRVAVTAVAADLTTADLTYGELDAMARHAAGALVAAGLRPEERLLLCMADSPELVALFLGGLYLGAVPVPVSTMVTAQDLATLAADSRARLLAVSAEFAAATELAAVAPGVREVVVDGDDADLASVPAAPHTRVRTLAAFLAAAAPADLAAAADAPPTLADSPAFWLYTSGTTGTPKAAVHRHGALRSTAETYGSDVLGIRPDDSCYSAAKFFFAYGLGNTLTFPFSVGARAVLDRARATPPRLAAVLAATKPSLFFAAPTAYAAMLAAGLPDDTFASVRLGVSAGEAFPADLYGRFTARFGLEVLDGIGSTEALHIFLSNRPGRVRPGTTGEVVPGYELRIENPAGEPVPVGEPGSLYVKGDSVADGYWCRSEVTRRVFRGEWLRTGDIYVRDADGYYTCLGRSDDVLKVSGMWVSPAEVETRLRAHPDVEQAVVVAIPDADGLDKAVACVVARPGTSPADSDLIDWCRAGLSAFKRPRHVLFLAEFPLTATGKVQRFRLREHAIAVLRRRGGLSGMLDGRLLVDAHVHVARLATLSADWHQWAQTFGAGVPIDELFDEAGTPRPAALDAHFAGQGVDHVLLFSEYSPKATGLQPIEDLIPVAAASPDRFRLVASINPHLHYPPAAELARQVSLGAVACKIHPVHGGFAASDRMLYPAYAWAQEHGLPVIVHCGTSTFAGSANAYADPVLLDPVFRDFPGLTVVLAHGGRGWWYDQAAFLALMLPQVWLEISGLPPQRLPDYYGTALRRLAGKMIFGTDWPGVPGVERNARSVEKVLVAAGCTDGEVAAALGGNAARVFGLRRDGA